MISGIGAPIPPLQQPARQSGANLNALNAQAETTANPLTGNLTPEQEKEVQELQQRDQEVRNHEQAHKTVGGPYAGAISYQTVTGPDGREYAVGGEVQIDVSPVPNNPEATVRKMDVVVRAALAPAEPSSQDFAVARAAQGIRLQAQQEAQEIRDAERNGSSTSENPQDVIQRFLEAEEAGNRQSETDRLLSLSV